MTPGPRRRPATLVEVVGPAGVGKSSVVAALAHRNHQVVAQGPYRRLRHLPAYGAALAGSAGLLLRSPGPGPLRSPQVANRVVRVRASAGVLRVSGDRPEGSVLVVDQGPVYGLARLALDEVDWAGRLGRWRAAELDRWATRLDLVVVLDAPTEVLVERIRSRPKVHAAQDRPDREVHDLVDRYRAELGWLTGELAGRGAVVTAPIDTHRLALDDVVVAVEDALPAAS